MTQNRTNTILQDPRHFLYWMSYTLFECLIHVKCMRNIINKSAKEIVKVETNLISRVHSWGFQPPWLRRYRKIRSSAKLGHRFCFDWLQTWSASLSSVRKTILNRNVPTISHLTHCTYKSIHFLIDGGVWGQFFKNVTKNSHIFFGHIGRYQFFLHLIDVFHSEFLAGAAILLDFIGDNGAFCGDCFAHNASAQAYLFGKYNGFESINSWFQIKLNTIQYSHSPDISKRKHIAISTFLLFWINFSVIDTLPLQMHEPE